MADLIKVKAKAAEPGEDFVISAPVLGHSLQPGDATRYELRLVKLPDGALFAWLNGSGRGCYGGRSMFVFRGEVPSIDYIAEKMGIREYEAEIFAAWLSTRLK